MGRRRVRRGPYGVGDDEDGVPAPIALRNARHEAARLTLEQDPRVRGAARVAATFHLDPVTVLSERVTLRRLVRIAAHNIVQTEASKAAKGGT